MLQHIELYLLGLLLIVLLIPVFIKKKPTGCVAVIERLGKFNRLSTQVKVIVLPVIETVFWVNIEPVKTCSCYKALKSSDNIIFNFDFQLTYQVTNPEKVTFDDSKLDDAVKSLLLQLLIDFFQLHTFDNILHNTSHHNNEIKKMANIGAQGLGASILELTTSNIKQTGKI